jgi:hypothetical protein
MHFAAYVDANTRLGASCWSPLNTNSCRDVILSYRLSSVLTANMMYPQSYVKLLREAWWFPNFCSDHLAFTRF